ncbi:MAG: bifunctional riboflavin kinase/FAD synthetase [Deltaproteobacteria bacterium]|nr:bifunctional riboflavin kinase/FAD synthetase [Deltaproteobacteria bacterium]
MDVFDGVDALPALPTPVVALGNFDGVHLGHRALFAATIRAARAIGGTAVALTFAPHPSTILAPARAPRLLTARARKLELIAAAGIDATVIVPFTPATAQLSADEFIDGIVVRALAARHVVVGWDFCYGRARAGTVETLRAHGARAGFAVEVVDKVEIDGAVASSTGIRAALTIGDVAAARQLLGRPPEVTGVVVHGKKLGRTIGVPTANVAPDTELVLGPGIYACRLVTADGIARDAVASLGTNPTVTQNGPIVLEVHVLDWQGDLYDQRVRVDVIARLRDEARFDGLDALVAQIARDIAAARAALA